MVILLLTACLFILKVSDNVLRLWLATWGLRSAITLCGFRLLTASVARRSARRFDKKRRDRSSEQSWPATRRKIHSGAARPRLVEILMSVHAFVCSG